jgi:hypothetical protein
MWGSSSGTIPYLLTKPQAFCCLVLLFLLLVLSAISLAVSGARKGGGGFYGRTSLVWLGEGIGLVDFGRGVAWRR